jgi:galactose mutarotase-like enzyme
MGFGDIKGLGSVTTISKGNVSAVIDTFGAKVLALYINGENILFYEESDISHSGIPICLPSFGPLKNGVFCHQGNEYKMGQHGFIRDNELDLKESDSESASYTFESSEATKEKYPFDFKLTVKYSLIDNGLKMNLLFENTSDSTIPIAPGVHPYFAVDNPDDIHINTKSTLANNNINGYNAESLDEAGYLEIVNDGDVKQVKIKSNPDMHLIDHGLDVTELRRGEQAPIQIHSDPQTFNRMAVWRKAADSKFICIEPAYIGNGLNEGAISIASGGSFETEIRIVV